jgi:hypothetical protein
MKETPELQKLAINTIRFLAADGVQKLTQVTLACQWVQLHRLHNLDRHLVTTLPIQTGTTEIDLSYQVTWFHAAIFFTVFDGYDLPWMSSNISANGIA